jgi:starch synthase
MINVCFVTSECYPFVKTGGLADVSSSLPLELSKLGCHVKIFVPLYKMVDRSEYKLKPLTEIKNIEITISGKTYKFSVFYGKYGNLNDEVYFIDCPKLFGRDQIYTNDADEDVRFILFQHAVIQTIQRLQFHCNIIHCNDWQTSLIPVYLKKHYSWDKLFSKTISLLTIHNIAYQGSFPADSIVSGGFFKTDLISGSEFELYGKFNFLKTGISFADVISTVSQTYALETQTIKFGEGLDEILKNRSKDYYGILNGIDRNVWNPETDDFLPVKYNFNSLEKKEANKKMLLKEVGLPYDGKKILIGIVSRLAYQKGFDIIIPVLDEILNLEIQLVILGKGEAQYEEDLKKFAEKYPDKMHCHIGYHNRLSHLITAGSDLFLMPSRYEPCGLNQMYSLNYGTIPIVRKTGGLADTVKDYDEHDSHGNGFSFTEYSSSKLMSKIKRALKVIENNEEKMKMQKKGMTADFSWKNSAKQYRDLYQKYLKDINC